MDINVEKEGAIAVVGVSGDVEAATAPALRDSLDTLLGDGYQQFIIDLDNVPFMDSSGLATLVQLFKRVRIGNGDVRLCSIQPPVQRIFELTRLDRVFDIFPGRSEALASLSG